MNMKDCDDGNEVDISGLSISKRDSAQGNTANSAVDKLYPFLFDDDTISFICQSNVMFLMRGPTGCGKSTVVWRLKNLYQDIVVCSADNYFLTADGEYRWDRNKLSDAHLASQQKARSAAKEGQNIVVDNTNIRRWEMGHYYSIAQQNGYIVVVVTPHTSWLLQPTELAARSAHGLTLQQCQRKVQDFQETHPYYWAWFLSRRDSDKLLKLAHRFFDECVSRIPDCAQQLRNSFNVTESKKVEYCEHYGNGGCGVKLLHCTAVYVGGHGTAAGDDYARLSVVRQSVGKSFKLKVSGIVITPSTVSARVDLTDDQLMLYRRDAADTEAAVCSACVRQAAAGLQQTRVAERHMTSSRPRATSTDTAVCSVHGCAHITLGYTMSSDAAEAGDDMLQVRRLASRGASHVVDSLDVTDALIHYYGDALCAVTFHRTMHFTALFSPMY